jgi:hypothetical protein
VRDDVVQAHRFELTDHTGAVRGVLACDAQSGAPTLTMKDRQGQTRVTVGIAWNDMPSIQLNAEDGTARVALVARPEGTGMVLVVDSHGEKKVLTIEGN